MGGLPYDCIANPLGAVRLTFDKAVASGSDPATLDGKDWGVGDLFRQFLFDNGGLSQVPLLNKSTIKWVQPNTLVRFRGMIQDMLGNEFYIGACKDGDKWKTNKFSEAPQSSVTASSDMKMWERRLLYCIPVPGQNSWVESSQDATTNPFTDSISPQREKRQRDDDTTMTDVDVVDSGNSDEDSPNYKKMRETVESSNLQKIATEGNAPNSSLIPVVESDSFSCLLKIYDSLDSDLKLNDVVEFIGVLTFDPDTTIGGDHNDELVDDLCEDVSVHLPPSKVPRLHCLVHQKLCARDFLPSPQLELTSPVIKEVREALVGYLTDVLGNDRLAAEYMLLHLLSKVHARVDSIAVGKLSLNFTCLNKESISIFGNNIKYALENLLPFTYYMPLTIDYLNTVSLAPKKDHNTNRLTSGILQLAEGSHLTINEICLQAGTLNSIGLENTLALKHMIESQQVQYDFTYYKLDMDANVQFLILSEGKSMMPADLVLPFCPSSVGSSTEMVGEMLKTWRYYLSTMKGLPHSIEPHVQKVVEEDLVAARQIDRTLGSKEFSRLLSMGRLMSSSFGETCLSVEHWEMVKDMERLRQERVDVKN